MIYRSKIHFEISERKILLRVFDILSVLSLLHLLGVLFDFNYFKIDLSNFYWTLMLSFYILFFGTVFEMYNLQIASNQFQITRSIILTGSLTVLCYLLTPVLSPTLPENRLQILLFYFAVVSALFVWRTIYVKFFASTRFFKKVIIICDQEDLLELVQGLQNVDPNYKIEGYVDFNSKSKDWFETNTLKHVKIDNIEIFINENFISEIVIASQKAEIISLEIYTKLQQLLDKGFSIREYAQVYESITQRIPLQYVSLDFYKYFPFSRSNQNKLYLVLVKIIEVIICIIGLTFGILMIPFILIANVIANKGPLLYTQDRVGKNGRIFKIYKLRSMIINAEHNGAVFATQNDLRITAFGKFLRRSRIDEIPQFINVLKGDMSIIGPRPERKVFVDEISNLMPFYKTRHAIKPGLTGWAQVNYSYGETFKDSLIKLQYDLYYIKHRSIYLDLNIIIKTISTVLFYRGQ